MMVLLYHGILSQDTLVTFTRISVVYAALVFFFLFTFMLSLKPRNRSDIAPTWVKLSIFLVLIRTIYSWYFGPHPQLWTWAVWINLDLCGTYFLYVALYMRYPWARKPERRFRRWWHTWRAQRGA